MYTTEPLSHCLAGQTLFEYAPIEERARRVVSKLRQTPRLIQAAEANIQDPPGIFVKIGAETFDGVGTFIERDLPARSASLRICTCSGTSPMRRPRRLMRSAAIRAICATRSRDGVVPPSDSGVSGSRDGCVTRTGSRSLPSACWPLRNASSASCGSGSARWQGGWTQRRNPPRSGSGEGSSPGAR